MTRELPRPFRMPWGKGQIVEEVSIQAPHWEPTIQLMEYETGDRSLRFCYKRSRLVGNPSWGLYLTLGQAVRSLRGI